MCIINHGIASEVEKGIVEVCEGFLKVAEEEIGDALLEISNGEILIETNSSLVTFNLNKRRISISTVESATKVRDLQPFRARQGWHGLHPC